MLTGVSCPTGAYSSIGQSPRLITGLFQVRTLVGPLFSDHAIAHAIGAQVMAGQVTADQLTGVAIRGLSL